MRVAGNGAESPRVLVERTAAGRRAEVLLTVGILANQVRGSVHMPGKGPRIDSATVERRPQTRVGFAGICQPSQVRREDRGVWVRRGVAGRVTDIVELVSGAPHLFGARRTDRPFARGTSRSRSSASAR